MAKGSAHKSDSALRVSGLCTGQYSSVMWKSISLESLVLIPANHDFLHTHSYIVLMTGLCPSEMQCLSQLVYRKRTSLKRLFCILSPIGVWKFMIEKYNLED